MRDDEQKSVRQQQRTALAGEHIGQNEQRDTADVVLERHADAEDEAEDDTRDGCRSRREVKLVEHDQEPQQREDTSEGVN